MTTSEWVKCVETWLGRGEKARASNIWKRTQCIDCLLFAVSSVVAYHRRLLYLEELVMPTCHINQHGSCKGKSCLTSLPEFSETVNRQVKRGDLVDIIYLGFQHLINPLFWNTVCSSGHHIWERCKRKQSKWSELDSLKHLELFSLGKKWGHDWSCYSKHTYVGGSTTEQNGTSNMDGIVKYIQDCSVRYKDWCGDIT